MLRDAQRQATTTTALVASAAAAVFALAVGCKKDTKVLDWDEAARSTDVVEGNRKAAGDLVAPTLFEHIPVDTPYVFASFEPIPPEYWHHTFAQLGPAVQDVLRRVASDNSGPSPAARALFSELGADLSAAGLERLGLSPSPRFAIYGLGPMPVVRLEISDAARLTATIERIGARVGAGFERRAASGRTYWVVDEPMASDHRPLVAVFELAPAAGTRGFRGAPADGPSISNPWHP